MWVVSGQPGVSGHSCWYRVAQSFVTLSMLDQEVLGALADVYWYQHLRNAYALRRSVSPISGSRHAPIYDAALSDSLQESYMTDKG